MSSANLFSLDNPRILLSGRVKDGKGVMAKEISAIHSVAGDSTKVDKLVKDIYGGDYKSCKFTLPGNIVASRYVSKRFFCCFL